MKILGLIPARGGSKGVPRKNIRLLNGKPLIHYTIDPARKSGVFSEILVSTDDDEIASVAEELGAKVRLRPAHLATDSSPTLGTVVHVLQECQDNGEGFGAVCLLQPTNPLRSVNVIRACVEKFERETSDSLISMRKVPHQFNPHWAFEESREGFLKIATGETDIIPRRQELPTAYYRDGSIYLTRTKVILEQKSLFGKKMGFLDVTDEPYLNIDTMEDWKEAERVIGQQTS
ncbi:MAG: acylneuraminate cytidylyltransferase family protein [Roseivirga sp.]|nr:acylneuraminate cytidylyltransferase family protein [Roseivirga sp.]